MSECVKETITRTVEVEEEVYHLQLSREEALYLAAIAGYIPTGSPLYLALQSVVEVLDLPGWYWEGAAVELGIKVVPTPSALDIIKLED